MAVNNFTGKNIQDTYQRVVQTDGINLADGTGSLLPISFNGNNVIISGTLSATEYNVTSSVTNVIFQQQSGSTIFGDSTDDTHKFTGSLNITGSTNTIGHITASGNISASGNILGDFITSNGIMIGRHNGTTTLLAADTTPTEIQGTNINLDAPVTASGNISSSGNLIGIIDGGKF